MSGSVDGLGIEKNDVERAIKEGMKWKEEQSEKWHAQLAGIETVFVKQDRDFIIITAHPAGRAK